MNIVSYTRVSTEMQSTSGLGIEAQRRAIAVEVERRRWRLIEEFSDALSARSLKRPGLEAAIHACECGVAGGLVCARLDRLSRSVRDFADVLERSRANGWALVLLDVAVDTSEPSGELTASILSAAAQYERRLVSARTSASLAAARERGVRLGRPPSSLSPGTLARVRELRESGMTFRECAHVLENEGHVTPTGASRWHGAQVRRALAA